MKFIDDKNLVRKEQKEFWTSDGKVYFHKEEDARYHAATHKKCECGNIYSKNGYCRACADRRAAEIYSKMPFKEWEGDSMVYSELTQTYYNNCDDLEHELEDGGYATAEDLMLVICEPVEFASHPIDVCHFDDCFPDEVDEDTPKELKDLIDKFNDDLHNIKPIAWCGGKFRTGYDWSVS